MLEKIDENSFKIVETKSVERVITLDELNIRRDSIVREMESIDITKQNYQDELDNIDNVLMPQVENMGLKTQAQILAERVIEAPVEPIINEEIK